MTVPSADPELLLAQGGVKIDLLRTCGNLEPPVPLELEGSVWDVDEVAVGADARAASRCFRVICGRDMMGQLQCARSVPVLSTCSYCTAQADSNVAWDMTSVEREAGWILEK